MNVKPKKVDNNMIKVCAHNRSGTMFVCALLYINFYAGRNFGWDLEVDYPFVSDTGEILWYCKYGKLFGTHKLIPPKFIKKGRSIYVKRDVMATVRSWYRRKDYLDKNGLTGIAFDDFLKKRFCLNGTLTLPERVVQHHENWEKTGIYTVQLEDVLQRQEHYVKEIRDRFGLRLCYDEPKTIKHKVGRFSNEYFDSIIEEEVYG